MATKIKAEGTVTAGDMKYNIVGFDSLDLPALQSAADYFGADQADNIPEQIANLAEMGVTWTQYAKAFKIQLPDDYEEDAPVVVEDEQEVVVEQEAPVTAPRQQEFAVQNEYLIKMVRDNPYFEVASLTQRNKVYKFTTEHPYAIMDAKTAQYVLEHEDRFRQAFPDELKDYYNN